MIFEVICSTFTYCACALRTGNEVLVRHHPDSGRGSELNIPSPGNKRIDVVSQ
jgi:hypothetical protein